MAPRPTRLPAFLASLAASACLLTVSPGATDAEEDRPAIVHADDVYLSADDLTDLEQRLTQAVFRAEASHMPQRPFRQEEMIYDGTVVAVAHDGHPFFLTSAAWLEDATSVTLITPDDRRLRLEVTRLEIRQNLAFLALVDADDLVVEPVELADHTPALSYAVLSPGTKYQQLVTASIVSTEGSYYWASSMAASNGYPAFTAAGELVGVHAQRSPSQPATRGDVIGYPTVLALLEPDEDVAVARQPDRMTTPVPGRTSLRPSTLPSSLRPSSAR